MNVLVGPYINYNSFIRPCLQGFLLFFLNHNFYILQFSSNIILFYTIPLLHLLLKKKTPILYQVQTILLIHFTFLLSLSPWVLLSSFNLHSYNIILFCTKLLLRPLFSLKILSWISFEHYSWFLYFNSIFCIEPLLIYLIYLST